MPSSSLSFSYFVAILSTACLLTRGNAAEFSVEISVAAGVLKAPTNGHIQLFVAPIGSNPFDDVDPTSSPDYFFGQDVFDFGPSSIVTFSGANGVQSHQRVYGWPNASLAQLPPGDYRLEAFMNIYQKQTRRDGSTVELRFPCGDGQPGEQGFNNPVTSIANVTITGAPQVVKLAMDRLTPAENFTGHEIAGCQQGNYADLRNIKYVKIRSKALSDWWGRDIYVGANVMIPHDYNASNTKKRYPVMYTHAHWPTNLGTFNYLGSSQPGAEFTKGWDSGIVPGYRDPVSGVIVPDRKSPDIILVLFRYETPWMSESYYINSANHGPWGDAINDELIPHLDATFNTIAEPYGRVQQGGSTGGWAAAASLIFRPDLFGAAFVSFPDPLDFNLLETIPLYTNKNAYMYDNGTELVSIRTFVNDIEVDQLTVLHENQWELTYGTKSRSYVGQWDAWTIIWSIQGLNGYPLEAWNKVTGEIYPAVAESWKPMDMAEYITSNWDDPTLRLGKVLKNRLGIYVGTYDPYFLNEAVKLFQNRVEAKGGVGWANFTYHPKGDHSAYYDYLYYWDVFFLAVNWSKDHAPNGSMPLSPSVTMPSSRGNKWADVIAYGGRQAALARQAPPLLSGTTSTVGKWDPGVVLELQWVVGGKPYGTPFSATQGSTVTFTGGTATGL